MKDEKDILVRLKEKLDKRVGEHAEPFSYKY